MTSGTYGLHQERAAAALHDLLVEGPRPLDQASTADLQLLRDQTRAGLQARIHVLGRGQQVSPHLSAGPRVDPGRIRGRGLHLIHQVLTDHPASRRPSPGPAGAPSDILTGHRASPQLEGWRRVGAELLLGNHILEDTTAQWHQDLAALGTVAADLAEAVEAFVVLDAKLAAAGSLDTDQRASGPMWDERGQRAICALVARESRWLITASSGNGGVDDTKAIASAHDLSGGAPATDWRSLSAANLHLAALVHPHNRDLGPDPTARLSVTHTRGVLLLQAQLCALVARRAVELRGGDDLRASSRQRAGTLVDAVNQTRSWVDLDRVYPLPGMRQQAHHVSTAIHDSVGWAEPTLADLARLDDSIGSTSRTVALALRSDLTEHRPRYAQRHSPAAAQLAPAEVTETSLYRACNRVIAVPQPDTAGRILNAERTPSGDRTRLRAQLAATPTLLTGRPFQLLDHGGHKPQHRPRGRRDR